jgi:fermentation-respiration switch protein FrsA (DUF1100 family)
VGVLALIGLVLLLDKNVAVRVSAITQPPRALGYRMIDDDGQPLSQVALHTSDDLWLSGWTIPSQNGAAVILQHGYGANSGQMLPVGLMLARYGYGVLLFDFRGHGRSEGDFVTFGHEEVRDTEAALAFLLEQPDVDPERIGIIGNSMGGATAILAAAENPQLRVVVTEGTFAEVHDIETGIRVLGILSRAPFDPLVNRLVARYLGFDLNAVAPARRVGDIGPRAVLVMHGGEDELVPLLSGEKLFAGAQEPKELWYEPAIRHNAFFRTMPLVYEQRIVAFLDRYLLDLAFAHRRADPGRDHGRRVWRAAGHVGQGRQLTVRHHQVHRHPALRAGADLHVPRDPAVDRQDLPHQLHHRAGDRGRPARGEPG